MPYPLDTLKLSRVRELDASRQSRRPRSARARQHCLSDELLVYEGYDIAIFPRGANRRS